MRATRHNKSGVGVEPNFVAFLRYELLKREWSQNKLSRKAGLSRGEISRIVNGKKPSFKVCAAIADALDLTHSHVLAKAGLMSESRNSADYSPRINAGGSG